MKVDSGPSGSCRASVEATVDTVVSGRRGDWIGPRVSPADTPRYITVFSGILAFFGIPVTGVLVFHGWDSRTTYAQAHLLRGSYSAGTGVTFGGLWWIVTPGSW
jgi:hypothetical protein